MCYTCSIPANAGIISLLILIPDNLGEKYMYANIVSAYL